VTTQSFDRLARIQVLLNTLVGEHHVRRALLNELCGLMSEAGSELLQARCMTETLLAELHLVDGAAAFDDRVRGLAMMVENERQAANPARA
jgi:hypothetical protein